MQHPSALGPAYVAPFDGSIICITGRLRSGESAAKTLGSGFIIGPYLAVTAKHVIEEFAFTFHGQYRDVRDKNLPGNRYLDPERSPFDLFAFSGPTDDLTKMRFKIDLVSLSDFSDYAVLRLVPEFGLAGFVWQPSRMHAFPPMVGSKVTAYGVLGSSFTVDDEIWYRLEPRVSQGEVKQIHSIRRDSSQVYFPSFETDAHLEGGMSGGPVVSQAGYVAGIVSSSMRLDPTPEFPKIAYSSHVASIWPLLGNAIELSLPGLTGTKLVAELVSVGFIHIEGADGFRVHVGDAGLPESITYGRPPEG